MKIEVIKKWDAALNKWFYNVEKDNHVVACTFDQDEALALADKLIAAKDVENEVIFSKTV